MVSFIFSSRSRDEAIFQAAAIGVLVFMVLFFWQTKVYDMATAMFFAFGLGMMQRRKWSEYFALLGFACANRETAFLMILIYGAFSFQRSASRWYLLSVGWQVVIFAVVQVCLRVIFAGNEGSPVWFNLFQNVHSFLNHPLGSLVHWGAFGIVFVLGVRYQVSGKFRLLKVAFLVMMPILMAMYLVVGWAFEIRVFAEVFPVVWLMLNRNIEGSSILRIFVRDS